MPPLRFNEDLSKAQSIAIPAVSGLARGDDHDALKFTYHHQSLAEPIIVHMIAHDCMNYPQNVGFIAFLDLDNAGNDLTKCLDAVCQKKKWSSIQEAVQVIAQAMTSALDKRHNPSSGDSEDSSWDGGSDFEELDPVEISSTDEDRHRPSRHYPEALPPLKPESLASLRSSLRRAQLAGMTVGIYPRLGSSLPKFISLSAPVTCLGVAAGILESWGLKQTDNLVLLIKIDSLYPDLADFLQLSSRQTVLQFRFGRCVGEKPSQASVQSAYRDTMHASQDDDSKDTVDDNAQFPFELINMSDSIAKLLNTDFMRLLATRRAHRLSWPNAQHVVSRLELQSNLPESIAQETDVENSNIQADPIHWQSLTGPISQDCAFDDAEAFSLPLVAMQLALHRLANCTRYCMVCNSCLNQGHAALKPYVCSKSLCLFQYLELGLGSSIEHEIINAPYVVDMLICFLYCALVNRAGRELPDGLSIKTAYVDDQTLQGPYIAAIADMDAMKLCHLDYSPMKDEQTGKIYRGTLRQGDHVVIIHLEPERNLAASRDVVVKSWCRLVSFAAGEWTFERFHHTQAKRHPKSYQRDSPLDPNYLTQPITAGNWRGVQLFGYWQNIDDFSLEERRLALRNIIDGIPSVLEMRRYLMARPGRRLATWNRINMSELAVLNWTIASNRSLIVQDDIVTDSELMDQKPSKLAWNKIDTGKSEIHQWMQFRFLLGSPEREQIFENKASQLLKETSSPTIFAWHGSRLKNWHSIIRTGLDFSVVENGRANGHGVYFSKDMHTSLQYSGGAVIKEDPFHMIGHWPKSELQIVSAIAVCELINSPSEFVNTSPHYVVDKLDWIQCRYLLVSINPSAEAIQSQIYEPQSNVTPAYVVQDEAYQIKHNLQSVEIPITAIPFDRRAFQTKTPLQTPTATEKVSLVEGTTPLKSNYEADDVELYLGVDEDRDGLYFSKTKRRGTSTSSKSSRQSQYSNKRAKAICESSAKVFQAEKAQNICDFDPNGLDMESLRSLVPPDWASTSKQAIRRLTIDLKDLHRRQTTMGDLSSGYYVHTDKSDNMFQWIVEMFNFDAALPLARDMQELGCTSIVLEFRFGPSYPMSPPFVRVIRPQFVPFHQGGGGHVTIGGAVCLELLTNSGWNPAINIDNVIMQIRAAISEPDPPARIDKKFAGHDYGVGEAVAAFTRLAQTHGWAVPEDFQHIAAL